MMGHYLRK